MTAYGTTNLVPQVSGRAGVGCKPQCLVDGAPVVVFNSPVITETHARVYTNKHAQVLSSAQFRIAPACVDGFDPLGVAMYDSIALLIPRVNNSNARCGHNVDCEAFLNKEKRTTTHSFPTDPTHNTPSLTVAHSVSGKRRN